MKDRVEKLEEESADDPSKDPNKIPSPCKNLSAKAKSYKIELTWTDPEDRTIESGDTTTIVKWGSTRIVKKIGSAPESPEDGSMILTSTVRNQYQTTPFIDESVSPGVTYYYTAYACSIDGVYNLEESPSVSAEPTSYKVMTVVIDLRDSNPETCGHYEDDAIDMVYGKSDEANSLWQEFFRYKPCLFKDGQVVGYLNPNDYSKFDDGSDADITSGDAGDVMIEFPRRGVVINKSEKIITISMTDDQDNPAFTYYAHTRGIDRKDHFYLGVYLASEKSGTLRSISGQTATHNKTVLGFRKRSQANGAGYEQMTWYQWVYLQVMYCLQFRGNLNSQKQVGVGYASGTQGGNSPKSGLLDKNGLIYGSSLNTEPMKLFGLENVWGVYGTYVDGIGCYTYEKGNGLLVATDNFNPNMNGYTLYEISIASTTSKYFSNIVGTSELAFYPISFGGSSTTYFCDIGNQYPHTNRYSVGLSGGSNHNGCGMFSMYSMYAQDHDNKETVMNDNTSGRLSYY